MSFLNRGPARPGTDILLDNNSDQPIPTDFCGTPELEDLVAGEMPEAPYQVEDSEDIDAVSHAQLAPVRPRTGTPEPPQRTSRRFMFTLNNYTASDETDLQTEEKFLVLCYGRETAPDTGTPHLQGYAVVRAPVRLAQLHREFPRAHWEVARSPEANCLRYCKKDKDFYLKDSRKPGKRSDLDMAIEDLRRGGPGVCARRNPNAWVKFHKGLLSLQSWTSEQKDPVRPLEVAWCYGQTGSGKTYFIQTQEHEGGLWSSKNGLQWFDGYCGQSSVLFDDFRRTCAGFELSWLLRLLDVYPLSVPTKGGFTNWTPNKIFITCPYHFDQELNNLAPSEFAQLKRRITVVVEFFLRDGERIHEVRNE